MDNRLTKRRLSDFLSYEWIIMIVISVVSIILWEFAYTVGAVRLTVGQEFKFYYDVSLNSYNSSEFVDLLVKEKTFSYDVLKLNFESLTSEYNVLSVRLSVQEGDILFTDKQDNSKPADPVAGTEEVKATVRAKGNIDNYSIYALDEMLDDAKEYLKRFIVDGGNIYDLEDYDSAKINSYFLNRMEDDNRFRSDEQKAEGQRLEIERITDLAKEVEFFEAFMNYATANPELGLLFNYTKYLQSYEFASKPEDKAMWQNVIDENDDGVLTEQEIKAKEKPYAIDVGAFVGQFKGKTDASTYFRMSGADTAKDVVVMAFDFYSYQPHLQFETISFMNTIIRECFNISLLGY